MPSNYMPRDPLGDLVIERAALGLELSVVIEAGQAHARLVDARQARQRHEAPAGSGQDDKVIGALDYQRERAPHATRQRQ